MAIGDITTKDTLTRTGVGSGARWCKANGEYWVLIYDTVGSDEITVESYRINESTGAISDSPIHTRSFSQIYGAPFFAKQISEGVVAVWGRNGTTVGGDGVIITISVSSSGVIGAAVLGSLTWKVVDDAAETVR